MFACSIDYVTRTLKILSDKQIFAHGVRVQKESSSICLTLSYSICLTWRRIFWRFIRSRGFRWFSWQWYGLWRCWRGCGWCWLRFLKLQVKPNGLPAGRSGGRCGASGIRRGQGLAGRAPHGCPRLATHMRSAHRRSTPGRHTHSRHRRRESVRGARRVPKRRTGEPRRHRSAGRKRWAPSGGRVALPRVFLLFITRVIQRSLGGLIQGGQSLRGILPRG